jgi:hypothetical protein
MTLEKHLLGYTQIRQRLQEHPLRQTEIPIEHAVSLPVPTMRWGEPAYAFFASPAERKPGQPIRQGPPDRWWAFRALGGELLVYSLSTVYPFTRDQAWMSIDVPPAATSVAVLQQMLKDILEMADTVTPAFFSGEPGDHEVRVALARVLFLFLPPVLLDQYRALGPDFFQWLEAPSSVPS